MLINWNASIVLHITFYGGFFVNWSTEFVNKNKSSTIKKCTFIPCFLGSLINLSSNWGLCKDNIIDRVNNRISCFLLNINWSSSYSPSTSTILTLLALSHTTYQLYVILISIRHVEPSWMLVLSSILSYLQHSRILYFLACLLICLTFSVPSSFGHISWLPIITTF